MSAPLLKAEQNGSIAREAISPERAALRRRESSPMDDTKNKSKALDLAVANIEKEYGKGSIMRLKDGTALTDSVQVVSTGSIGLDIALGIGGYPRGPTTAIYGPESSGKTTLTLHAIPQVQKAGGVAAFIDAEHALDPTYARQVGVKT